ncbi:Hypothetical predicted protein [Marmota monax]|uniref:Uncharacterized protein n=1 Tax=Marmota monax TaxID=9995 RepID=A0A5E4CXQ9_MARMO|nr:Hypothetical predicted protein [Marmota monax]
MPVQQLPSMHHPFGTAPCTQCLLVWLPFVMAQCMRWLHLLSLSVVCCVFVTQPLMICIMALGFAWKKKDDNQFFAESLYEATRNLDLELEERSGSHVPLSHSCCISDCAREVEKVLAARQRERSLRWLCPPSKAQLRVIREKIRKKSRTEAALRWVQMCIRWVHSRRTSLSEGAPSC